MLDADHRADGQCMRAREQDAVVMDSKIVIRGGAGNFLQAVPAAGLTSHPHSEGGREPWTRAAWASGGWGGQKSSREEMPAQ